MAERDAAAHSPEGETPHYVKPSLRGTCSLCAKELWSGPNGMPHHCEPFEEARRGPCRDRPEPRQVASELHEPVHLSTPEAPAEGGVVTADVSAPKALPIQGGMTCHGCDLDEIEVYPRTIANLRRRARRHADKTGHRVFVQVTYQQVYER